METVAGIATSRGFASGPVFLYAGELDLPIVEYRLDEEKIGAEVARYREACAETRRQLEGLVAELSSAEQRDEAVIFRNHLVMLEDEAVTGAVEKLIREGRVNCEAAIRRALNGFRESFGRMNDPYLRERVRDIDDVERRMLRVLAGRKEESLLVPEVPSVIVADDLTPSETVTLPRKLVLGIATNRGSATSHVALLARAAGIPAVTGLGDVTKRVQAGERVLLDGTNGTVTMNADRETREQFARLIWHERECLSHCGGETERSGLAREVKLEANVQPGVPFGSLAACGAEGVGLYRSEYLWMGSAEEPTEEEQEAAYEKAVLAVAKIGPEARVVFRVLDIGGDKITKSVKMREANPFLGCRSLRYLLKHRDTFRTQLRAILKASAKGRAAVMYPMVATLEELREANAELHRAMQQLSMAGIAFDAAIPAGCMIEIPSAALNAKMLAKEVSFFSIGTNDLVQYTLAADRGNEAVSYLYQPTNPAVVKLVAAAIRAAKDAGIECAVCGESASDPVTGLVWAALGATSLSMSAGYIPTVRRALAAVSRAEADALAAEVLALAEDAGAEEIRRRVSGFLEEKGVAE